MTNTELWVKPNLILIPLAGCDFCCLCILCLCPRWGAGVEPQRRWVASGSIFSCFSYFTQTQGSSSTRSSPSFSSSSSSSSTAGWVSPLPSTTPGRASTRRTSRWFWRKTFWIYPKYFLPDQGAGAASPLVDRQKSPPGREGSAMVGHKSQKRWGIIVSRKMEKKEICYCFAPRLTSIVDGNTEIWQLHINILGLIQRQSMLINGSYAHL